MIVVNGVSHEYSEGSLQALMDRFGIEPRGVAVAVDGEVVARSLWAATVVADGSVVEIVTAVAGG